MDSVLEKGSVRIPEGFYIGSMRCLGFRRLIHTCSLKDTCGLTGLRWPRAWSVCVWRS